MADRLINKRWAERLFDKYNAEYFDGRLSDYGVVVLDVMPGDDQLSMLDRMMGAEQTGYCEMCPDIRTISLKDTLTQREGRYVLVHEMAHAATGHGHDEVWFAEMKRLKSIGAPVSKRQTLVSMTMNSGVYPPECCAECLARFKREDGGKYAEQLREAIANLEKELPGGADYDSEDTEDDVECIHEEIEELRLKLMEYDGRDVVGTL